MGQWNPETEARLVQLDQILQAQGVDLETLENNPIARLNYWQGFLRTDDGEAEVVDLAGVELRPERSIDPDLFTRQGPVTVIHPTQRRQPEGDVETLVFFGDTHHPYHDKRKMALANLAVRELQPDVVTYIGDDLDMALFSRFESRQEWLTSTQAGIDQFHTQLAQTRADIGSEGKIVAHQGNHCIRFEREIRKYNAELLGIKRGNADTELGVLTLEYLLATEELGVEYVSGYPAAEYWYNDNLKSYHGRTTNSSGLAASKEVKDETVNFVHGHTHQAGIVYRTMRDGRGQRTIFGMEVGTHADQQQIPSGSYSADERGNVLSQHHNWQTGLGLVRIGEGQIVPQFLPITDDGIMIDGKVYRS